MMQLSLMVFFVNSRRQGDVDAFQDAVSDVESFRVEEEAQCYVSLESRGATHSLTAKDLPTDRAFGKCSF